MAIARPAAASVNKCVDAAGAVSYQQLPCAASQHGGGTDIPSEFPPPNVAERERLLQREADLYRRLEAQRDRLSAEAIARLQRPEPVTPAVESVSVPVFIPLRAWRTPHRPQRDAFRDWSSGRLR